jgi:flagellar basal-body rod protein FlgB
MISMGTADKYVETALNARALRQDLIASNIANIDTPFYRSKDIDFESELARAAHREFNNEKSSQLQMAKTTGMHLDPINHHKDIDPTLFYRDGHMARNDGNTVDLDVESSELSKNSVMYDALLKAHTKNKMIFMAAIESSKQL